MRISLLLYKALDSIKNVYTIQLKPVVYPEDKTMITKVKWILKSPEYDMIFYLDDNKNLYEVSFN